MSTHAKWLSLLFIPIFGILSGNLQAEESKPGKLFLYTPNTKISIPPGEAVDYSIDVINKTSEVKTVNIFVTGLPRSWNSIVKSGGWNVSQISVLPDEKKTLTLKIETPLNVNKGAYRFKVVAGNLFSLPLVIVVSEQGTFKTEFSSRQPNIEGHASSTFTFNAELRNRTADKQLYALRAIAPRGWNIVFKSSEYKQVTSVNVEANATENLTIEIKPPDRIEAGKYKIPITAGGTNTSAEIELVVEVTGSFSMELTTPRGLLSTSIIAGEEKKLELVLKNTGSSELKDVALIPSSPSNWEVTFDPKRVDKVAPGGDAQITAIVKADKKALSGDYVTNFEAKTPEISSKATFRFTVKTPMLFGWIGIFIIIIALGSVYYLFRKYGRR